jgi:putative transcriptional regulator
MNESKQEAVRDFEEELRESIEDIRAYKRGERKLRVRNFAKVSSPAEIRSRLKLSQQAFAGMLGVSVRTIQEWEQGRRQPRGPAVALLRIADQHPEVFLNLR